MSYLGHSICTTHWNEFTADDAPPDALRMALGIEAPASTATEVDMSETKKSETKVAKKGKAERKGKPPKAPKAPKNEGPLVTFAIRIHPEHARAIHAAAGPRRGSAFAREVLVCAANGDLKGVQAAIDAGIEATKGA
ncbi:MAG: hypothetical protein LAO51_10070 [Acidobacteriia bacterium]|nr:hypothetical protein [Terriglobia bacterium]